VDCFRRFIAENLPDIPEIGKSDFATVEMGYVEPGHGPKGRRVWVYADSDLRDMYKRHQRKKHVLLWCYNKKSSSQDNSAVKGSSCMKRRSQKLMRSMKNFRINTSTIIHQNSYEPGPI